MYFNNKIIVKLKLWPSVRAAPVTTLNISIPLRTGLDKPFSCPKCRRDTTRGVDNLQTRHFFGVVSISLCDLIATESVL